MTTVRLVPKTNKAKNRLNENGAIGNILEVRDTVLFSSEPGPWLAVDAGDPVWRWVHSTNDKHFTIKNLDEPIGEENELRD